MPKRASSDGLDVGMSPGFAEVLDDVEVPAKRRPWSPDEDEHLRELVDQYGIKSWAAIATNLKNRNGKQCRERWRNHLRPQLNKGDWSAEEDVEIWDRVQEMGTKWAQISEQYMPQRTDNDIKNRWNSIIRKNQHPAGRDWRPDENEARALVLGSASRTQATRRNGGGEAGARKRARALESEAGVSDGNDEEVGDENDGTPAAAGRKLFGSPGSRDALRSKDGRSTHSDAVLRNLPRRAAGEVDPHANVPLEGQDAVDACRLLVGGDDGRGGEMGAAGEISADTFDVEAFLPLAHGSISQMCSPVADAARSARPASRSADAACATTVSWFDPDLESLSPLLTPSLRHQLRALMATPAGASGLTPSGASANPATSAIAGLTPLATPVPAPIAS